MKIFASILVVLALTGCSSGASQYYQAVENTAKANADAHAAKMNALAIMAQSGDPSAQGAAVMAIALSPTPVMSPQYVESAGLSWARTLATPAAAVAGLWLQTDLAKTQSNNNLAAQLGQISSQESIQMNAATMQSNTILGITQSSGSGITQSLDVLGNIAVTGFDALNTAGSQTVGVANTGFGAVENISVDNNQLVNQLSTGYNETINTFIVNPLQTPEPLIVQPVIVP